MPTIPLIKVASIIVDENQPRKSFPADEMNRLKSSIKSKGIMSPLIVETAKGGKYRLLDGERRFRAAMELGLKEVPAVEMEIESESDRLIQQFQIQELHLNWTPVEKAFALTKLADEMELTIDKVCKMLNIPPRNLRKYKALTSITDKVGLMRSEIPLEYIEGMVSTKNAIKRVVNAQGKPLDRNDEKDIERALIVRIKEGSIKSYQGFSKVKDAIFKDIKFLDKLLNTRMSPEAMFYESKAQGAYHLRNSTNHAGYLVTHLSQVLKIADIKPTEADIIKFKLARKFLDEVIDKAE